MITSTNTNFITADNGQFGEVFEYQPFQWSGALTIPFAIELLSIESSIISTDIDITFLEPEIEGDDMIVPFSIQGTFKDVFDQRKIEFKTYQFFDDSISEQTYSVSSFNDVPYRTKSNPLLVEIFKYSSDSRRNIEIPFHFTYSFMFQADILFEGEEMSDTSESIIGVYQNSTIEKLQLYDKIYTIKE